MISIKTLLITITINIIIFASNTFFLDIITIMIMFSSKKFLSKLNYENPKMFNISSIIQPHYHYPINLIVTS